MSNNPFLTNVILVVIAALLLVLVIQNGMNQNKAARPNFQATSSYSGGYADSGSAPADRNPTVNPNAAPMAHNMFFMAVRAFPDGCSKFKILDECNSPAAIAVKKQIEEVANSGKGPRQVFDYIVETWGEQALTEQAAQIRNQRVRPAAPGK